MKKTHLQAVCCLLHAHQQLFLLLEQNASQPIPATQYVKTP